MVNNKICMIVKSLCRRKDKKMGFGLVGNGRGNIYMYMFFDNKDISIIFRLLPRTPCKSKFEKIYFLKKKHKL